MAAPRGLRGKDLERAMVVDDVMSELDTVAIAVVDHLQAEMECYRALPAGDLEPVARRNVETVLRIVRERRHDLTAEERDWFGEACSVRSRQGLRVADVLRGWRIGTDVIWEYLDRVGRKQGVGDDILLDLMRETSRAVDPAIVAFVTGHHREELERVRDEDHVRGELVQRVLRGLLVGSELREQCSVWGLDPNRSAHRCNRQASTRGDRDRTAVESAAVVGPEHVAAGSAGRGRGDQVGFQSGAQTNPSAGSWATNAPPLIVVGTMQRFTRRRSAPRGNEMPGRSPPSVSPRRVYSAEINPWLVTGSPMTGASFSSSRPTVNPPEPAPPRSSPGWYWAMAFR